MNPSRHGLGVSANLDVLRPMGASPREERFTFPPVSGTAATAPRVLVAMLYSGEAQMERALSALATQRGVCIHLVLLSGFTNREGHDRLYYVFMENAGEFDYFLKLDADMEILHACRVATAIERIQSEAADHLVVPLFDWLSDRPIHGAHLFRSHMVWEMDGNEKLFVDPNPANAVRKVVVPLSEAAFALHNREPAEADAYAFGVHRARKAMQRGSDVGRYRCQQARDQMRLLGTILAAVRAKPDRRRWFALVGAADEMRNLVPGSEYRSAASGNRLELLRAMDDGALARSARTWWSSPLKLAQYWVQVLLRCFAAFLRRAFVRLDRWVGSPDKM